MDVLVLLISLILLDGRRGAASRGRRGGASGGSTPVRRGTAWWRQRRCDGGAAKRRKSSTLALALGMTDRGWRNDASGWAEEEEASWRDEPLMLAPDRLDALGPYVTGGTAGNDAPRIDLPAEDVSSLPRCSALVAVAEKEMGGSSGANMAVAVTKPFPTAMEYWQKIFPETPMPPAILDLLTPLPTVNMPINFLYQAEYKNNNAIELYYFDFIICPLAVWNIVCKERMNWATLAAEGLKEVSVSYGSEGKEEPKKAFPMGRYMLDKEREMTSRIDKEDLREVSVSYDSNVKLSNLFPTGYAHQKYILTSGAGLKEVSVTYGSDGEEEPRKTFSQVGYMLDKERKKSSDVDEEGLKEVMVSYGSNGKEETSKTTPMGGYMVHMKNEKSLQAEKDGLKEVSVSYGSNGEEETSKTFAMGGYMVDKERGMSLQGQKEGLKEASVSYGSNDEEETRKIIPMKGYMVDWEHEKSLQAKKEELKEVSVSYGHEVKLSNLFPTRFGHKNYQHTFEGMDHGRHVHAHGNKMQQLADVFFFRDALRPGSVITPTIPPTTSLPAFLPRHVADAIPFSADRFADVLAMFAPASLAMAREIRWALDTCGQRAAALLPGEKAGCATSLESLADLAASLLGTRDVSAFSAADLPTDTATTPARRGRYNVTSARELSAMAGPGSSSSSSEPAPAAVVACHDLTYPYAVFYCHSTEPTAAYAVTLVAATTGDGDGEAASPAKMEALAVCHLDTSRWRADNPFFVAHGVKPGEVSVCHFLTKLSIVWVPRHEQGAPRAAA
uniref:BURP domain-containing protein n=1 Tax=Oryza meridionalis TaxID=40149 RepID=A0A0E0E166_9ORYZ